MKLITVILILLALQTESDWKIRKVNSGITVSTRKVKASDFQEFKASTSIENAELKQVLNIILDVDNYKSLFPDCIEAHKIKEEGAFYDIHYFALKSPWPVQDRDAVYEQITKFSRDQDTAWVKLSPMPDLHPLHPDRVRMRDGKGYWQLYKNENNALTVIYQFHGAPGGKIPAWLANQYVVSHPLKTLRNLRETVNKQIISTN